MKSQNRRKSIPNDRLFFLLFSWVLVVGIFLLTISPLKVEAYMAVHPERGRYPATPEEAEGSRVDFRDAFVFPGNFGTGVNDPYANHAYLSAERANVVAIYDGVQASQKSMVWYGTQLDLNQPFEFEYYVFLSNQENKMGNGIGDGIAFVMQNDPAGPNAIGGRGGGIGVYPNSKTTSNMIYNALALEFDTYDNDSTHTPNYDAGLFHVWPHIALGTTATINQHSFGPAAIQEVYNNFQHRGLTYPESRPEADTWFGAWKKVSVKWEPQSDKVNGLYTYQFADYSPKTVSIDIDATFQSVWSSQTVNKWDRKVTWGFVGSNHLAGNAFGVMITKLPQQPVLEVSRLVRNATAKESEFKQKTTAKVGDELEYKVNVKNTVVKESNIILKKATVIEALEHNQYLNNLKFSNSIASPESVIIPSVTLDGKNNFTFTDNNYDYGQGQTFEYKYSVTVGSNTTDFVNDVAVSSVYSTEKKYGETTVIVTPEEFESTKKVDGNNPIVGEEVTFTVETSIGKGRFLASQIKDSLPTGMELIPNTTKIYNKGQASSAEVLVDSEVWAKNQLTVKRADSKRYVINGGAVDQNTLVLEYKARPTKSVKGEELLSEKATISGTNNYRIASDKQNYSVQSNDIKFKVKTELTISFKDILGDLLNKTFISSTNEEYNQKNPVVLYFNTGDNYDVKDEIEVISKNLLKNQNLTAKQVDGELTNVIPKEGANISIVYSNEGTLTIKFVDEEDKELAEEIVQTVSIGDTINLTTEADVLKVVKELKAAHYDVKTAPTNEAALKITKKETQVKYIFSGKLQLVSVPATLNFGLKNTADGKIIRNNSPEYKEHLVIADTRINRTAGWTLKAVLSKPLTSGNGKIVIPDAIRYKNPIKKEFPLNADTQVLIADNTGTAGEVDISKTWGDQEDSNGFKIEIPAVKVRELGKYQAHITYYLAATYEP